VILGVEVRDGGVAALTVNDSGDIVARAASDGIGAAAVADAVRAVADVGTDRLGIAVRDKDDPALSEAITAAAGAASVRGTPRIVTRGVAMALGEQWAGAGRGHNHVVAVCVSDRVYGGIVADGRPFEGGHGLAGAAGWLALNPVEREDYRKHGCLEAEIGGSGIVRRLVWRLKAGDVSRVRDMAGGDISAITVQHIFEAARSGDGVAISVVRDTARYVGMAIGNVTAIVDPEVIVLGGMMADAADLLIEPARAEAGRRMPPGVAQSVEIVVATLGGDAGPLGAARAAMLAP
jgi:predicted NBD/HSP70 family sugar kinase